MADFLIVMQFPQNSKNRKNTLLRGRYKTPILVPRFISNRSAWAENFDVFSYEFVGEKYNEFLLAYCLNKNETSLGFLFQFEVRKLLNKLTRQVATTCKE